MESNNKLYNITNSGLYSEFFTKGRVMLGSTLKLTGCEISINSLPADTAIPFLHSHELNEEVYMIIKGSGMFMVDDEVFPIHEGHSIRVSPSANRTIKAGDNELVYICIQAEEKSLTQSTHADGIMSSAPLKWK